MGLNLNNRIHIKRAYVIFNVKKYVNHRKRKRHVTDNLIKHRYFSKIGYVVGGNINLNKFTRNITIDSVLFDHIQYNETIKGQMNHLKVIK